MLKATTQTGRARGAFKLMPMKRRSFPLWLLRDVLALLGAMLSFWTLIIFAMSSARKAASLAEASPSIRDHFALLLVLAEARLDYALWRQAYRRIGWHPRGVSLEVLPPSTDWPYTQKRLRDPAHALRNMNQIVESYVDHIRKRFGIGKTDLVAHGSTDARQRRAAHHELVSASPFALHPERRAQCASVEGRARPSARTRTAPASLPKPAATHLARLARETALSCPARK